MSRTLRIVAALVVVQAALVGLYWWVEHRRDADGPARSALGTAPPQRVDGRLPPLTLRTREGERVDLGDVRRPTLVHVWATWCHPCREELPGLLALPDAADVDVVAVALDREWAVVDRFLSRRRTTSTVVLGDPGEAERALGVRQLPVTFLVAPGGDLRLRFDGARDWTEPRFVESWLGDGRAD